MRLSKNFTLSELTRSNTARRLGINNTPSTEEVYKLTLLATELLQPLRERLGALRVTSGYRSKELNAIFGSKNSQHCKAEAVDLQYIRRGKMDNIKIWEALIMENLEFDQCILEFGDATEYVNPDYPDWVHLSWKVKDNRRQILVAYKDIDNKTNYRPSLNYNSL
tara:strand:- start:19579 stop:20073 length:495 start_codon:yes stop_codon:yes gene_type:complete